MGFIKIPFTPATGIPGTPKLQSLQKAYAMPFATVPPITNQLSRVPSGWTTNPLSVNTPTGGYIGNGFNGSVM